MRIYIFVQWYSIVGTILSVEETYVYGIFFLKKPVNFISHLNHTDLIFCAIQLLVHFVTDHTTETLAHMCFESVELSKDLVD
jgi:hypothetical protein